MSEHARDPPREGMLGRVDGVVSHDEELASCVVHIRHKSGVPKATVEDEVCGKFVDRRVPNIYAV